MEIISSVISALLFAAFVPGVLFRLPERGSRGTVLVVHAVLFAIVTALVMRFYWHNIRGYIEPMGNYGSTCPNGYVPGVNQGGQPDCVPSGHVTYDASTGNKPNSPATK
jgi:phosphotransferase system  glucose/maltose/N-acetylglucosamine-specific IIC component